MLYSNFFMHRLNNYYKHLQHSSLRKITLTENLACTYGDHKIPDRLRNIPTDANPNFFDMVEYFFHRACIIVEDKLVEDLSHQKGSRLSVEKRKAKVQGILTVMETCTHILEVYFPVKKDNGHYEVIKGYRAQHSMHRTPCKGEFWPKLCELVPLCHGTNAYDFQLYTLSVK